ncbi:ABC transporter substrate-binding protein [Paenibacillus chitinolyticus]|uniref:ABC transporter substrate-binding protein n=1 Tax=Paenibacillus chitinolyticus TaxID=79263 RepID=UPI0026E4C044|nr:ABC transporter substrate-binding protein [Paenibacillus chitinolyticus]GKS15042.1 ABC transporter substrate-binding protein [Paenibacillus chitinolyticus]
MNRKKNMMKSGVALILASGMLLAGCSANNGGGATDSTSSTAKSGKDLAPYEVTMAFYGNDQKDLQAVQDEMNKILKEKINTTVKLTPISISAWQQQTNLMLAGNEKVDLMFTSAGFNYGTQVAKGQLLPLDDLVEKYGAGIKNALEPYQLSASKINGKTYSIPAVKDMGSYYGIVMRKDLVDKYKIDLGKIKTLDDLDSVFQTIKDNEPNMTPLVAKNPGTGPFYAGYVTYDGLNGGAGVLPDYDNNMKVVDWYETAQYADQLNILRRWYQAGYLLKDAATSKTDGRELVKAGKAFAYFSNLKPESDVEASRKAGKEMTVVQMTPVYTTTDHITSMMWGIPKNSKDPERSMMVLNLLYSDKQLYNTLAWGIEGKNYVKKSENVIDYPAGVDITNNGYNFNTPYMFGNQFLSYTWPGNDPDISKKIDEFNKSAKKSKALGFTFDVNKVKTELAAVNNVVSEYGLGLDTGTLDPAEHLPKFIAKLKSAGIDKIISEKQKQLDEWVKTQK